MSAFLTKDNTSGASWEWALIYLLSSIFFGLWCVVQRLYLDGVTKKEENINPHHHNEDPHLSSSGEPVVMEEAEPSALPDDIHMNHNNNENENNNNMKGGAVGTVYSTESDNEESEAELLIMEKRQWASNKTEDNASKVVLLVVGLFFQLFVSFILFPIDAIPWFGTSSTAKEAWTGFQQCFIFIFQSWLNVRYGLLYSLGYAMSFLGCTYLNEHSPTLASVVLQLAGPITSIVILIIPQWNVYQDHGNVGHKVGGVILLFVAALLYHLWEQQSMRDLLAKTEEKKRKRKQSSSSHHTPDHEHNDNHNNDERNEEARVMMVESDRKLNEEL
ncbi:hypothetical protein AGDE_08659 [Angomonas deanei]|uniref:Uncharacterized protein n=1 Tax=Angomonas deanei TaxID=59799 RepID=A0A7G2CJ56_9TRYP|nr:hypothetical protein AGDE_08659 [Angomonas deanei]CAD2219880.1 hypothetical protein, conserved [Angomonas deanei]|eukprot:EPY32474.1 hypothetical protein AGDE_08659 [Angomonas deanei]